MRASISTLIFVINLCAKFKFATRKVLINSEGATATDSALLVAIDLAPVEAVGLDVAPKPGEAADLDGVPALDSDLSLAAVFDSDHVE